MALPGNGIYIVLGEVSTLLTAMKRGTRWSSHSQQDKKTEALIKNFNNLKDSLNQVGDLDLVSPSAYLGPFLQTIKSDQGASVSGSVTSLAISSINKFLSYELIGKKTSPQTIEKIADAVTHAKFVGTDEVNDAVVLMKILQVLRTLMVSPAGTMLSDEKVCEIMFSCFKICFETRLSDLLRRCAEHFLKDMVQLVFMRLPFLDSYVIPSSKKLELRSSSNDNTRIKRKYLGSRSRTGQNENYPSDTPQLTEHSASVMDGGSEQVASHLATTPQSMQSGSIVDMQGAIHDRASQNEESNSASAEVSSTENLHASSENAESSPLIEQKQFSQNDVKIDMMEENLDDQTKEEDGFVKIDANNENIYGASMEDNASASYDPSSQVAASESSKEDDKALEYVNTQGVRFKTQDPVLDSLEAGLESKGTEIIPYGLGCVIELIRFLVSLCNSYDKQNTEVMTFTGLSLLTVALELGADSMSQHPGLLALIKDNMCRNFFSLLNTERISLLAADLRCCFLLFESQRSSLKFQLEIYLSRLAELISSEKSSYEVRELALEALVQLWRVPGLITELYLNYDCDLYCPNLYEDLTKLLSKNVFPVTGIHSTNLLALDALLAVIDSIEGHCHSRISNNIAPSDSSDSLVSANQTTQKSIQKSPSRSPNSIFMRVKVSDSVPSHEQLMAVKRKKKLLASGTDHFNAKPKKGIEFLQEQGLLSTPLDANEVVHFLKENPHLSKKMIGEFISNRNNLAVLDAFVKSFDFSDIQIDEALRMYLETFRLPGEAPLIALVMEQFADHWHKCNGEPFVNSDAAFTLAYAVIMLNTDQHSPTAKRQQTPMTAEDFRKNLKKVNGGQDFDHDMLNDIYQSIKNEEIVMPAEHTGLVRENYLWKVLLRRGNTKDGFYIRAPDGMFDHDLFSLIWGPIVAALGFVFDKSSDPNIYMKAMIGFRKCATISAHYGMSNEFDNLTVSLCKFSTLSAVSNDSLTVAFGENHKARVATKTMFNLIHRHGDTLREGWKSVLECILQLYRCNLLPKILVEAEDFIDLSGKISLVREETPLNTKAESGLLSSLYSYIALAAETGSQRTGTVEDEEAIQIARDCIHECHLEQLITESKFLRIDSMQHLVTALIHMSYGPEGVVALGTPQNEDKAVFFLEFMLKIVIQNRDRVTVVWENVRDHIYTLLVGAAACDHHFLVERSVVALLRLSIRLMRREEMSPVVVQSLRMLFLLKSSVLNRVVCQISYGLYELLKTSAANIHTAGDWTIIFTLLECVGAGMPPPKVIGKTYSQELSGTKSDGEVSNIAGEEDSGLGNERGYTSDSELSRLTPSPTSTCEPVPLGGILVSREGETQPLSVRPFTQTKFTVSSDQELQPHDPFALVKCCESLAFLVRDVAHITPYNFERCISCIRTFVEASLITMDKKSLRKTANEPKPPAAKPKRKLLMKKKSEESGRTKTPTNPYDGDESDSEDLPSGYHQVPIQLLDLMHTLHTRTAQIHRWWAEENSDAQLTSLWAQGWCPLLQGIARLCCDCRKQVRMSAMTYLQRALLVHDLQALTADEWAACFNQVLFPLMTRLLSPPDLDETRMRAATLLSKVFLHHLTPLQSLPSFLNIWLTILDLMGKYMVVHNSDLLSEAIPESLKNMLLVMDSAKVFSQGEQRTALWDITWNRINAFLPNLKEELFKSPEAPPPPPPQTNLTYQPESFPPSQSPPKIPSPVPQSPQVQMPLPMQMPQPIQMPQSIQMPQMLQSPQTPYIPQTIQMLPPLLTSQTLQTSPAPQGLPAQPLPPQALQFSQPLQISQTLQLPQTPLAPHIPQSPASEMPNPPVSATGTPHTYLNI